MGRIGDMTELELFKVSEELKDRFSMIFKHHPDMKMPDHAIEKSTPALARIINNFNRRVEDTNAYGGVSYLIDTVGYYIMLCADMQKTNEELLELLEKFNED